MITIPVKVKETYELYVLEDGEYNRMGLYDTDSDALTAMNEYIPESEIQSELFRSTTKVGGTLNHAELVILCKRTEDRPISPIVHLWLKRNIIYSIWKKTCKGVKR